MNFELTAQMVQAYTPFAYLLSADTDKKVEEFNKAKKALPEASSEIAKYDKAAKEIAKRSINEVRFNMCTVTCQARAPHAPPPPAPHCQPPDPPPNQQQTPTPPPPPPPPFVHHHDALGPATGRPSRRS